MIRDLAPSSDRDALTALFTRAADYITLEFGSPPTARTIDDFFADRPPDAGPKDARHLGVFDGATLQGVIAFSFGYPETGDCYIGLLMLSPDARGQGIGADVLQQVTHLAQARGATRQLVAVLEANPGGRAFWERAGFGFERTFPDAGDGHIRHRLTRAI